MTIEEIRQLCHASPFVPFAIHKSDGTAVQVEHPDFIALSPRGFTVTVYAGDAAASEMIAIGQIVSITKQEAVGS